MEAGVWQDTRPWRSAAERHIRRSELPDRGLNRYAHAVKGAKDRAAEELAAASEGQP